ncbi:fatty acid amide hydrolase-like isoform X3 [Hibiscus syriacus]|uniref:Fatty acid amide hydrolase-like isoform X3 n=1 Tax=Hibiscus syriacus TaxID=106335 RepID=A0A6A2XLC8_HIBSY|nr:fatty acid amide hydrolase-like isoform X3 [Hibiscus syriacus]
MGLLRDAGVVYKPVEQIDLGPCSNESYFRVDKAPRMAGFLLKIFAWFLESRIIGALLLHIVKKNNQVHKLVTNATLVEPPMFIPLHPITDNYKNDHYISQWLGYMIAGRGRLHNTELNQQEVKQIDSDASPPERVQEAINCIPVTSEKSLDDLKPSCFRRWTIADYSRTYSTGDITPLRVAEHFIDAVRVSCSPPLPMSFFINYDAEDILRQARESTIRYERGNPISALDGVPIAIKDEIDCYPYPTTGGTKWLQKFRPCTGDACCVMRLRSCGAILVGKTNMHELGAGVSGINPHYGPIRNPYDPNKIAGGSSSGSSAVVSSGLCPVALGVDSGGSVRMPASLCGVVGFKPTFGCIPHSGVLPLNWTVGTVGIIAATLEDAFIVYAAISGELHSHKPTTLPPKVHFPLLNSTNPISNIRFAKYGENMLLRCSELAMRPIQVEGVTIPDIESMLLAHYVTISSECCTSLSSHMEKLDFAEIGWDVRVALRVCGAFHGKEYIKAQKMRRSLTYATPTLHFFLEVFMSDTLAQTLLGHRYRQMQIHNNIFAMADVIVTPSTGRTAYSIIDDALKTGEVDCINGAALIRYQIAPNFLGLPAVTVPVGYDKPVCRLAFNSSGNRGRNLR